MNESELESGAAAPPLAGGEEPPATRWPTVLGALSIVYAIVGAAFAMLGAVLSVFGDWFMRTMAQVEVQAPAAMKILGLSMAIASVSLGLVLLVGGVGLVRRRRYGPRFAKAWVVLRVLLVVAGLATLPFSTDMNIAYQKAIETEMVERAAQRGQTIPVSAQTDAQRRRMVYVTSGVMTAITLAYPFFLGFWLSSRAVRAETDRWD